MYMNYGYHTSCTTLSYRNLKFNPATSIPHSLHHHRQQHHHPSSDPLRSTIRPPSPFPILYSILLSSSLSFPFCSSSSQTSLSINHLSNFPPTSTTLTPFSHALSWYVFGGAGALEERGCGEMHASGGKDGGGDGGVLIFRGRIDGGRVVFWWLVW
jgi:hypothetical protein